jgi:oligopeptide transport system substrate-binding protein
LARHYVEAGEGEKAVDYLLQAGDRARGLYAHQEAIDHYQQALAFLKERDEHERAARTLMKLGLTYHTAFQFRRARGAYQEGFALRQRAGETTRVPTHLPPAPHALRLDESDPISLDPAQAGEESSALIIEQLFSGLVELSPELDVVPDVARSWEVLEGGSKYLFHLRDDARWSDEVPVMAEDFEYAWKRVLDPATGSLSAHLLYPVKGAQAFHRGRAGRENVGVRALDELTLAVELEEPTSYFLHLLAECTCYPVPRHLVEAQGEDWTEVGKIVSNGPFRLEAWWPGESMVLARNTGYRGRFKGNVQQVELSLRREDLSARLERYEAGDLDILSLSGAYSVRDLARQRHAGDYVLAPRLGTYYIGFNVGRPPFDDRRVRRAFALAIDRETLAEVVLRGYYSPATGGFIPPGVPGHSPGISLPYHPEGARKLLAEAGYPDGKGFPLVDFLQPAAWETGAKYLQAQWRENLGVKIRSESLESATYFDELDRDPPPLFAVGWYADYPDPDSFLRGSAIRRITRWRSEAYDRLLEKARRVLDQGERVRLYRQADKILVEEAAIVPVGHDRKHFIVKPWISKPPITGIGRWFWKDVFIEPH